MYTNVFLLERKFCLEVKLAKLSKDILNTSISRLFFSWYSVAIVFCKDPCNRFLSSIEGTKQSKEIHSRYKIFIVIIFVLKKPSASNKYIYTCTFHKHVETIPMLYLVTGCRKL